MGCAGVKSTFESYTRYHLSAFVLTFLSYSMLHATRKSFSNVKTTMSSEWTPALFNESTESAFTPQLTWNHRRFFVSLDDAEEFMGTLDASFMFAYAVGLFVSGFIADRNDLRLVLSIGMALTSLTVFVYGCLFEWLHFYSVPAYVVIWAINGFLQSSAWPCVVAVMGNWFGKGSRGLVLGVWSACASVGNILGSVMVSAVLDYGYDYAFLFTACVLLATAVLDFFGLVPTPQEVGLSLPEDAEGDGDVYNMELEVIPGEKNHQTTVNVSPGLKDVRQENGLSQKNGIRHENGIRHDHGMKHENGVLRQNGIKETKREEEQDNSDKGNQPQENGATNLTHTHTHTPPEDSTMCDINLDDTDTPPPPPPPPKTSSSSSSPESSSEHPPAPPPPPPPQAINFFTALLLPGVVPYALCYAFLKLVNYSFFFWLPFYLSSAYGMAETVADQLSIWYDLGGVVGGTLAGFLSDRLQSRTVVVVPMLVAAVPLLFVYGMTGVAGTLLTNGGLLFGLGCLIGGVSNLISAAISADLGRQKALKGNPKALSTVTGILDGTGSTGAALGQVAVPHLQVASGWRSVFYLFMVCTFLTAVCIIRIFWQEAKALIRRLRQ